MSFLIQQFNCQPQIPYGNPPDFFPLWFAAREDNTLSSRLTRPLLFPSESFNFFNEYCHLAWDSTRLPNKKDTVSGVSFYLAASYPPRFTTDLAVFLMGNPTDFLSIMTYSPRKQYFVSAPSISAFVSLISVLAWEQRQRLVVAGYHSTGSKSEWISYKW